MNENAVRRARYAVSAVTAVMLLVGASACSDDEPVDASGDTSTSTTSTTEATGTTDDEPAPEGTEPSAADDAAPAGELDAARAIEAALGATAGAVVELSEDDEDGRRI